MIKTHLIGFHDSRAVCGTNIYREQGTHDPEKVDCLACCNTTIWKSLRGPEKETSTMTFDEAYEALRTRRGMAVAREMEDWHPSVLGEMLRAVAMVKSTFYPGVASRDYYEGMVKVVESARPRTLMRGDE